MVKLLDQATAQAIDSELLGEFSFHLEQLMELAGLAVAQAIQDAFPTINSILIICGPGNNGGDGLVAARHLAHFNYSVTILYPRQGKAEIFKKLVKQCESMSSISFVNNLSDYNYDIVVDAIFGKKVGFSFKPPIRKPFDSILKELSQKNNRPPIVSIDIPSGWDVEKGPTPSPVSEVLPFNFKDKDNNGFIRPTVLVSLTAPKLCSKFHNGIHYLGGRFIPPALANRYNLQLPKYEGSLQIIRLS